MRIRLDRVAAGILFFSPVAAHQARAQWTDWGGGYVRGPDSASATSATSGAGAKTPAPVTAPSPPANVPLTDWGGGYLRGGDSASTTVATSGAGNAKPTP
ncbi:MAG: hypothetical protein ACXWLJ_01315 [Rhizomicrobium sp.]